jgi:hypothetical protein
MDFNALLFIHLLVSKSNKGRHAKSRSYPPFSELRFPCPRLGMVELIRANPDLK